MHPTLSDPSAPQPLRLSELAASVASSWRTLLAGAVAGTLLGVATVLGVAPEYHAVATVRVDPVEVVGDPGRPYAPLDMTAEESVARSRLVAVGASDLLDGTHADDIGSAVTVRAVEGSSVLQVSYSGATARSAAAGANAVAHAYLAARALDAMSRADRLRERVADELEVAEGLVRDELESTLTRVELADLRGGEVIDPARAPRTAAGPGAALSGTAGALLGLLMAVPFAARRRPVRHGASRRQVTRTQGAPAS